MTRASFADWEPTPANFDHGDVIRPAHGMVVHTAVGSEQGTSNWENNPSAHVSSYFVVGQDGTIIQKVDLDDKAWTQSAGNAAWVGVENEGNPTTPLTAKQLAGNGQILAWLHELYGIPLELTTDPINGRGLGYHQMGGLAWSPDGHQCPGPIIVAQLPLIIVAAQQYAGVAPTGRNPMYAPNQICSVFSDGHGHVWGLLPTGAVDTLAGDEFYGAYGDLLDAHGHHLPPRGDFGHITARWDGKPGYTITPLGATRPQQRYDFGPDHPGRH